MKKETFISVVIVTYNATRYIELAIEKLSAELSARYKDYEIVVVDDGSLDRTAEAVERLQKRLSNIQLYVLGRRYGDAIATIVGLDNAIGDYVAIMDAETDTPETISVMAELAQNGYDVVYAAATGRETQQKFYDRLAKLFYNLFQRFTGNEIPEQVSRFRLFSRAVVNYITAVNDRHQLLRVLPAISGFSHTVIPYAAKASSKSRSLMGRIGEGINVLFSSSVKPLRFATYTALAAGLLNLIYAVYVVVVALIKPDVAEGWVSLSLQSSGMFFLISLILTIISEYLYGIMERTQNRPLYNIARESSSLVFKRKEELNVVDKS
jgi:glycosyltransferase involved in cell wall biosynthesis